jgi:general secretion pathway protein K
MMRQRGTILISALVLVALATIVAATLFFETMMAARRSKAAFELEQALQLGQGAEALAAYVLSQDEGQDDTAKDDWTEPYGPVDVENGIQLAAQVTDEQARFNLNTLVNAEGEPDEDAVKVFKRLLELAGLETRWAGLIVDWIDADTNTVSDGGEDDLYTRRQPAHLTANVPLTSVSELMQLPDFTQEMYRKLAPHVTALPPAADRINVCLADGIVLDALYALSSTKLGFVEHSQRPQAEMDKLRENGCFPRRDELVTVEPKIGRLIAERTSYFRLTTSIRIGTAEFTLYSLLYRDGRRKTRAVARTFGTE